METEDFKLIEAARAAQKHAYAPYSSFKVGAALLDSRGRIFAGCNIEDVSLAQTVHAEKAAIVQMVCAGGKECVKICVVTDAPEPVFPCGLCRQFLFEFGEEMVVIAVGKDRQVVAPLRELFPSPFLKSSVLRT